MGGGLGGGGLGGKYGGGSAGGGGSLGDASMQFLYTLTSRSRSDTLGVCVWMRMPRMKNGGEWS